MEEDVGARPTVEQFATCPRVVRRGYTGDTVVFTQRMAADRPLR
jgi:hypothetical protein